MQKLLFQYLALIIIALGISLYAPFIGEALFPYNKVWIFGIILLSTLKVSTKEIVKLQEERQFIVLVTLMRLVLMPIVVYSLSGIWAPDLQLPLTLISLAPVGTTSALFTEILGGKTSLALALTAITGMLAPFWIPVFIKVFMGQEVQLSWQNMFIDLAIVLIIPVLISEILQFKFQPVVGFISRYSRFSSMVLLLLILLGSISTQIDQLVHINLQMLATSWLVISLLFIGLGLFGWGIAVFRNAQEEIAVVTSFILMNFSLSIYLSSRFFAEVPMAVLVTVLTIVPWNLSYIVLGALVGFVHSPKK